MPRPAEIDFQALKVPSSVALAVTFKNDEGQTVNPGQIMNNAFDALSHSDAISNAKRTEIIAKHGSVENYRSVLKAEAYVAQDGSEQTRAVLSQMLNDVLKPNIPIEDEQEDIDGLMKIMRMNNDKSLTRRQLKEQIGEFNEVWIVLRDPETGKAIAAANTAMYSAKGTDAEKHVHATANNIYLLVNEDHRSLGLGKMLMDMRKDEVHKFLDKQYPGVAREDHKFMMFNEQNNPALMSLQDMYFDTCPGDPAANSGSKIDQFIRQQRFTTTWNNRTVDFPYVQPGIAGGDPCPLFYNTFTVGPVKLPEEGVPTSVLKQNLRSFCAASVFKSAEPLNTDPTWLAMKETLDAKAGGTIKWAPQVDFIAYAKKVHGFAKDAVMGVNDNNLSLKDVYTTPLGELGVEAPLKPSYAAAGQSLHNKPELKQL